MQGRADEVEYTGIKGKVALVTGAAQGIGEAIVRALAEAGAIIAALDLNGAGAKGLRPNCEPKGARPRRSQWMLRTVWL